MRRITLIWSVVVLALTLCACGITISETEKETERETPKKTREATAEQTMPGTMTETQPETSTETLSEEGQEGFLAQVKAGNYLKALDIYARDISGNSKEELLAESAINSYLEESWQAFCEETLSDEDMDRIAEAISLVVLGGEEKVPEARAIVKELTDKYPLI